MKLWWISLSAHSYRPNALDFLTNFSNTDITFAAHQQLKSLPLPFWERAAKGVMCKGTNLCLLLNWTGLIVLGSCLAFGQGATAALSGIVRASTRRSRAWSHYHRQASRKWSDALSRSATSSENGGYNVQLLPVGAYEITTDMPGFKQQVRRGINLVVGREAVVNLTLEVGAAAELVTVTDEAPIVNTTLSSTSGLINETQIKGLPLNGRSFDQLLTLNVGTVDNRSNVSNNAWTSFSVAEKRPETNRFLMNGGDYPGSNSGGTYITPSGSSGQLLGVEAVREYNVLQHTIAQSMENGPVPRSPLCRLRGRTSCMAICLSTCATALWTPATFSKMPRVPSTAINFGGYLGG